MAEERSTEEIEADLSDKVQQAIEAMKNDPNAVVQRLRARGATDEQIESVFKSANVDSPIASGPAPGQVVVPTQQIQPATVQHGPGASYNPQGQVVYPTQQVVGELPRNPAGQVVYPTQQIVGTLPAPAPVQPTQAGIAPMTDAEVASYGALAQPAPVQPTADDVLRGGMYVQPQQGIITGKQ